MAGPTAGPARLRWTETLGDPGSVELLDAAEGAAAATATAAGRPVVCFEQDGAVAGGSLGERQASTLCRAFETAEARRVPLVGFVESAGARMQEGVRSLDGYARLFKAMVDVSGRVPMISVATGASAGGGCYCSALTDFTIMARGAAMFLTGPRVVAEVTGESVSAEELGGHAVHQRTGVCHIVAKDETDAALQARELLGYLPSRAGETPPRRPPRPPGAADPSAALPDAATKVYDVRKVIAALVDGGEALELAPRWARNMVTALARLEGAPVAIVANQPAHRGGVIDSAASEKGAAFIRTCASFGLPLVVLVDTPGFMPGTRQEAAGVIRHGASLLRAFAAARVPKVTVILRRAFGGGYITMNSRDLGADFSCAWPQATIGIMAPEQAIGIVARAQIEAAADPEAARGLLAARYAETQSARAAAKAGAIDEVLAPPRTRERLLRAIELAVPRGTAATPRPARTLAIGS